MAGFNVRNYFIFICYHLCSQRSAQYHFHLQCILKFINLKVASIPACRNLIYSYNPFLHGIVHGNFWSAINTSTFGENPEEKLSRAFKFETFCINYLIPQTQTTR
jgi:hypothetical protein